LHLRTIDKFFPCDIGAFVTIQEIIMRLRIIVLIVALALGLLAVPLPGLGLPQPELLFLS
jgi:hypothetical protein